MNQSTIDTTDKIEMSFSKIKSITDLVTGWAYGNEEPKQTSRITLDVAMGLINAECKAIKELINQ